MDASGFGGEEYARRNGFVCVPGTLFPRRGRPPAYLPIRHAHRKVEKVAERPPFSCAIAVKPGFGVLALREQV
jgi:hypothetical protein